MDDEGMEGWLGEWMHMDEWEDGWNMKYNVAHYFLQGVDTTKRAGDVTIVRRHVSDESQ